jgi:endonuclease YncB( thermonuclease family)
LVATFTVIASVFALQPAADPPKPFTGKVVGIADGDTITVLLDKQQHKIRLEGIDAPESGQAFGTKAKQVLGDKIFGKDVKVVWTSRDKYKRILGHIYLDDRWINKELVAEGFAWHFVKYSKDVDLAKAEKDAREGKKGLWADARPIPPWDYRKGNTGEPDDPNTVFITALGKKYHRASCKFVAKSKTAISLKDAKARYEPCSVCKPPK